MCLVFLDSWLEVKIYIPVPILHFVPDLLQVTCDVIKVTMDTTAKVTSIVLSLVTVVTLLPVLTRTSQSKSLEHCGLLCGGILLYG